MIATITLPGWLKAAAIFANMAATAGREPDAAAGSESATVGPKTAASTAAASGQKTADASEETTAAATPAAARDDAKKPWWTGMNWWEREAAERKYWFHKWGLDELQEKQETTAMAYEETWYKAKAAEDNVAWYGKRCRHLENEIDELHWCKEKTKKETDKKFERMQKKLRQMEKMIEHKFVQERGKRRELELMVARVFEDLQHKVAWLMVQLRGWSSWKPWTTCQTATV